MSKRNENGLTDQQERFCQEYLKDLNGKKAAIRAAYSPDGAESRASKLLASPIIKARVQVLMDERAKRVFVDSTMVLEELVRLATVDLAEAYDENGQLLPIKDMPEDVRRAIAGIEVHEGFNGFGEDMALGGKTKKVRFYDKTKALEMIGKHLKMFTEKHEHTGKDGAPIQFADQEAAAKMAAILNAARSRKESEGSEGT